MKRIIPILILAITSLACDSDRINNRNPYIPNYNFEVIIDMNLPLYSQLQFPSNAVYLGQGGARGLIVFNTGSGYAAYDAACPNQNISSCSTLQIDGIMAICPCDDAQYNLFTGESPGLDYPLKRYRVNQAGSSLIITN